MPQSQVSRVELLEQQMKDIQSGQKELESRMQVAEKDIGESKNVIDHLSKVVEGFEVLSGTVKDLERTIKAFLQVLKWFAGIGGTAGAMVLGYWLLQLWHIGGH